MSSDDSPWDKEVRESPPLARSLRELRRATRPARDLWPEIVDRLGRESTAESAAGSPTGMPPLTVKSAARWGRMRFVAALLLVGLVVALAGDWLISHRTPLTSTWDSAAITDTAQYLKERPALLRSLNTELAALPPASREKVLADLQTIERSMRDVQTALGRDPGNALLRALLLDAYQDEEHLLLTVQEASTWTRRADDERRKS